ncbi:response regulator [Rhizobium sp. TRM95796]|uniref:response regulator n=1 Tax=Rhizobium sp. TRM95796 TaxID=2979862 RepID=UPI0021E996FD|nr:response regulator [Rhizobium sp. TRM95796]MCV3767076.1 response regulator [Rhizobium sp. TRM95796]
MTGASSQKEHILVVDDDQRIRQMLARYFEDEGYRVTAVADGAAMRDALRSDAFDIVLLDLMLPGESGLELARDIRARFETPIIMLTGKDDVLDRIVGLELGADDYMSKPFHLREVLARIRTVLRRRAPPRQEAPAEADQVIFEGWTLDLSRRSLTRADGQMVDLTTGEFDMLAVMARNAGRVLSRDRLMDLTRGRNLEAFDRTIDAQIARLRKKIEDDPANPQIIKSVRGIGYVFTSRLEPS